MIRKYELEKIKRCAKGPLVLLIVLIIIPFIFSEPSAQNFADAESKLDNLINDAKKMISSSHKQAVSAEQLAACKKAVADFEAVIPAYEELPDVIDTLTDLSEKHGALIKNIIYTSSEVTDQLPVKSLRLDMRVSGGYEAVVAFILAAEQMKYPAFNEEIQLGDKSTDYSVKMRVLIK